jgi:hypothetical protein
MEKALVDVLPLPVVTVIDDAPVVALAAMAYIAVTDVPVELVPENVSPDVDVESEAPLRLAPFNVTDTCDPNPELDRVIPVTVGAGGLPIVNKFVFRDSAAALVTVIVGVPVVAEDDTLNVAVSDVDVDDVPANDSPVHPLADRLEQLRFVPVNVTEGLVPKPLLDWLMPEVVGVDGLLTVNGHVGLPPLPMTVRLPVATVAVHDTL